MRGVMGGYFVSPPKGSNAANDPIMYFPARSLSVEDCIPGMIQLVRRK